ncbi:MAG: patatin-like phospholipase family protein [Prevotella sp.]|nr:patatin-like phospholipase family protein [Prevotella sp.]
MRSLLSIICWITLSFTSFAQDRPKIGLVLGGGGAKGAAQVGVLKYIEEAGVPIDYIVGTSIGSIIGGLYSVGYRSQQLDSLFTNMDWEVFFSGSVSGIQQISDVFASWLNLPDSVDFDSLPIPFRCVATDISTTQEVVISRGNMAKAMRASMSIPGAFKPVRWGDMLLVDGGMHNNLPVDVAKEMGADVIIAIDLTQNKHEDRNFSLKETLGIGGILDWLVSRPDWKKYNKNRKMADIYINPDLKGYDATSFSPRDIKNMIFIGEEAGKKAVKELTKLTASH